MPLKTTVLILLTSIGLSLQSMAADDTPMDSAEQALADAINQHTLVAVGDAHWHTQVMAWIIQCLKQPAIHQPLDAIVVEFGNSRHQAELDRYITGEDNNPAILRKVTDDTLHFLAWVPEVYRELFTSVRNINLSRPQRPLRIILAEAPFDWQVEAVGERWLTANDERDPYYWQQIQQQVLDKKHKALLIFGSFHLPRLAQSETFDSSVPRIPLGALLHQHLPEHSYVIWPHTQLPEALAGIAETETWQPPVMVNMHKSALGQHRFAELTQRAPSIGQARIADVFDAYLYLGDLKRSMCMPASYLADSAWHTRMQARARALPEPQSSRLLGLMSQACANASINDNDSH